METLMSNWEREISNAIEQLGFSASEFVKSEREKATEIVRVAKSRFVADNPRVWWLGFRQPYDSQSYGALDDWERRLKSLIPRGVTHCWLIAECNHNDHPVYQVSVAVVASVLKECSFFEYYLVDSDFEWIIADTDHNSLIVARHIDEENGGMGS
jgi:hypothetical protein